MQYHSIKRWKGHGCNRMINFSVNVAHFSVVIVYEIDGTM